MFNINIEPHEWLSPLFVIPDFRIVTNLRQAPYSAWQAGHTREERHTSRPSNRN